MARRHLAVALLPPAPAATEVDALRRALGDPDVGRVPPHITLVPPVNVREEHLDDVLGSLRDAAAAVSPLTLELGPTATFLPTSPTLYLTVGGPVGELIRLRELLLVGPFDRPAPLPFVPHVTLRTAAPPEVLERDREALDAYRVTSTVTQVSLLEETDQIWRPIADPALGRARLEIGRGSLPLELSESSCLDPAAAELTAREWSLYDAEHYGPATRWEQIPFALTARREGRVVGVATGWTGLGLAYLSELLVASESRREGVGSHLLTVFDDLARRRGCRTAALRTEAGSRALTFYERRGWVIEATFSRWLADRDFVQLRRDL